MYKGKLLVIDPSITSLGYALFDKGILIKYGRFITKQDDEQRFNEIHRYFDRLAKAFMPDCLVIESQYMTGIRSNSILKVAEVKGVIRGAVLSVNEKAMVFSIMPQETRKFFKMTGKRDELKKKAIILVKDMYPAETAKLNDNEADAVLLGLYFIHTFGKMS